MIVGSSAVYFKAQDSVYGSEYGVVSGVVQINGVNAQAIVRCYEKSTGRLLKQTISGENGFYSFKGLLRNTKYFVLAHNLERQFNAVIQDNVVPK